MLSLARALATSPKLIIADEMSLGLAPLVVDLVFDGLVRAREAGVTVIMIEQYVHRALGFADDCLVLQRGDHRVAGLGARRSRRGGPPLPRRRNDRDDGGLASCATIRVFGNHIYGRRGAS